MNEFEEHKYAQANDMLKQLFRGGEIMLAQCQLRGVFSMEERGRLSRALEDYPQFVLEYVAICEERDRRAAESKTSQD